MTSLKLVYGDRFCPLRSGNTWDFSYKDYICSTSSKNGQPCARKIADTYKSNESAYSHILKNEVLPQQGDQYASYTINEESSYETRKLFHYAISDRPVFNNAPRTPYSISPISNKSTLLLLRLQRKQTPLIPTKPYKILDGPDMRDDFYLNLVDWSSKSVLCVALDMCVYLYSTNTGLICKLCDLLSENNHVSSVAWNQLGSLVAIGTEQGSVHLCDPVTTTRVSSLKGGEKRVGVLAWNYNIVCSGSRDGFIRLYDIRSPSETPVKILTGHNLEVCGLKWSHDKESLASGGNDNKLYIWNIHSSTPIQKYSEHNAAVKAIAWSPHRAGLLASGGGTTDKCIRFWNTLIGAPLHSIDTGSQISNLAWSKYTSELVSTHGWPDNKMIVWKYPSLEKVVQLDCDKKRILYMAMSPCGQHIVTASADETLRFWKVFTKKRTHAANKSVLNFANRIR